MTTHSHAPFSPTNSTVSRRSRVSTLRARVITLCLAVGLSLGLGATALAVPAHASAKPVVRAPAAVVAQIADTLDVEARCLTVRQARSWRAWAWVIPNYRIGCDHQLDTAVIFAKQVDRTFANTGIEGAPLVCATLKRQMSLYVEDDGPRIGKRTMRAFRNFKAAGYCVRG